MTCAIHLDAPRRGPCPFCTAVQEEAVSAMRLYLLFFRNPGAAVRKEQARYNGSTRAHAEKVKRMRRAGVWQR